jgi:hypothetical protein
LEKTSDLKDPFGSLYQANGSYIFTAVKELSLVIESLKLSILYLLFLMPSGWSAAAELELVLKMGKGTGMYSDYGRSMNEVILAYSFLSVSVLWLIFGTVLTLQIARRKRGLGCLGLTLPIAFLIILPVNLVYIAGVGHF